MQKLYLMIRSTIFLNFLGILDGRVKVILGLFFNLSKYKQKMRQCAVSKLPQRSIPSSKCSTDTLESPDSDKRYVTPPSSVQNSVQQKEDLKSTRPMSDQLVMNKSTDSKSRLPVFGQKKEAGSKER